MLLLGRTEELCWAKFSPFKDVRKYACVIFTTRSEISRRDGSSGCQRGGSSPCWPPTFKSYVLKTSHGIFADTKCTSRSHDKVFRIYRDMISFSRNRKCENDLYSRLNHDNNRACHAISLAARAFPVMGFCLVSLRGRFVTRSEIHTYSQISSNSLFELV